MALSRNQDAKVRVQAMESLAHFRHPTILPLLLQASQDSDIRQGSAIAMGQLNDPKAIPRLAELFRDPDTNLSGQALVTLGKFNTPASIALLLKDKARLSDWLLSAHWVLSVTLKPSVL
jgi:HEAT repeat protein